jgi:lysozyme family protein
MSFDQIMAFVLKHEGGYVNDPRDPGGETKYGISKRAYPRVNIKALTLEGAREIYRRDYWDRLGGIEDDLCRMAAFDTAVNCGISRAILWARRADEDWKALLQIRRSYYRGLADRRRAMMKYLRGWVNRVDDLEAFLDTLIQKNATPQETLQGGQI